MSLFRTTHPPKSEDDAFAETVVEELPHDAAEMIELDGQALDDATLEALPTLGHVGRYVLKHQLGAGGLGAVYAAIDPLLSRPIAVKMLKLDAVQPTQREALEQQLLTEARAAAGLSHPHIVTVYDAGLADSGVYVAMERLQGKDLRQLLAAGWRPDPEQAVRVVKRVADALAYAHTKGVIHCDVKPANVFMVGRTQPKLLDFGIARLVQQGHPEATASAGEKAAELGSPYYAAPEQMRGQALDARVDVYALGLVAYELLTGRRAFGGESLDQIRHAVLHDTVPPADQLNPQVDRELSQIVAKAMARDPDDRHANARHLVRALRRWSDRHETQGEAEASDAPKHRPWLWAGVAAGGTALAIAVAVFVLWPRDEEGRAVPTAVAAAATEPAASIASAALTSVAAAETAASAPAAASSPMNEAAASAIAAAAPPTVAPKDTPKEAPSPTKPAKDSRTTRAAAGAVTTTPSALAAAPSEPGVVQLAISPWGEVEVDGVGKGTTPPLSRLTLAPGRHRITVRNGEFAPFSTTVTVESEQTITVRHRFGS